MFDSEIFCCSSVYQPSTFLARPLNSSTATHLKDLFLASAAGSIILASQGLDVEDMVINFNGSCTELSNTVAPLKVKKTKRNKMPWLNEDVRALRKECRRAERKWKWDKLQISYQFLQTSLAQYQEAVSLQRANYFSSLIAKNSHCPKTLFSTLNSVLNHPTASSLVPSTDLCIRY